MRFKKIFYIMATALVITIIIPQFVFHIYKKGQGVSLSTTTAAYGFAIFNAASYICMFIFRPITMIYASATMSVGDNVFKIPTIFTVMDLFFWVSIIPFVAYLHKKKLI